MVLDQIQCPKKGNNKMGVNVFAKKWLPEMEKYAIDYVGLGDLLQVLPVIKKLRKRQLVLINLLNYLENVELEVTHNV